MSTQDIIERLKALRGFQEKIGDVTFVGECPSWAKAMGVIERFQDRATDVDAELVAVAIQDWSGMTEADLFPDGDKDKPVAFDKDLFNLVIRDRPDWWKPLARRIRDLITSRQVIKEAEIKNSPAGTTQKPSRGSRKQKA